MSKVGAKSAQVGAKKCADDEFSPIVIGALAHQFVLGALIGAPWRKTTAGKGSERGLIGVRKWLI